MKKKSKIIVWCLLFSLLLGIIQPLDEVEMYQAATSYTNAKEFYESTALKGENYHAEAAYGNIYYATQAKLASSSTNKKYYTVGFDITLSGSGHSVSFTVQRTGGSMTEVDSQKDETYEYVLYSIEDDKLLDLASKADATNAAYVLDTSTINVEMDAILVTKEGDEISGDITEDGSGGITQTGTIYRLKNSDDLKALKDIFTGHEFKSYKDIKEDLYNYLLQVRYNILGVNQSGTASVGAEGYSLDSGGFLQKDGSTYITKGRVLQQITLLGTDGLSISKTGYHLNGGSEWITGDGRVFGSASTHMPKVIDPVVGTKDHGITMYANWKPNTYSVHYDNNGGIGKMLPTSHTYDQPGKLRTAGCIKEGYSLVPGAEWNTKPDGSGTSYGAGDYVMNLTSEDGGKVTLYANWKEAVYGVETNKDGGSDGTDTFYEQYKVGWFSDPGITNTISSILIPQKAGYWFEGYYTYFLGMGDQITDKLGTLLQSPDFFKRNSKVYAKWEPKNYSIFFNKQGGSGGLDSVTATYDKMVPFAGNSPVKDGYSFMGYFDALNGAGTRYYNEHMSGEQYYKTDGDLTLFAHWLDETPPIVTIEAPIVWSNASGGIKITATAIDVGTGLNKVELYRENTKISSYTGLNGKTSYSFVYQNKTEGVYQYRVIAYDMSGNTSEAYVTVKYDITAPTGSYAVVNGDLSNFGINVTATDYKIP